MAHHPKTRSTLALISASRQHTQRIVLENISWSTYQSLLQDLGDCRAARLIYDQGILELILPCDLHEIIARLLTAIVTTLAETLNLSLKSYGATTIDRADLACAIEPDACFELPHNPQLEPLGQPPTLVIDIDFSDTEQRRLHLYRQLQISEIWQYSDRHGILIYQLQDGNYRECNVSPTFPCISCNILLQLLQLAETQSDDRILQIFRQWLQQWLQQRPNGQLDKLLPSQLSRAIQPVHSPLVPSPSILSEQPSAIR